ncbi:hypothetical protein MML48_7g00007142 [Holotrichia oblita]|uniref:Uncharacterized protein n=2 Tax=Holotrichia oblita TaxID=644536 RepID=A0ACB9SUQ3_HOLOL|nr:hypothetical protein MML48_7g00015252 [Holotrichia oblita]KAI4458119.1 hypothetical protein MML48_7g00007142 [Holotrichia oblita]
MRKALKVLSAEYWKRIRKEQEEEEYKKRVDDERKKRELIGKIFPRTKGDFAMLYFMLDKWKNSELQRITSLACGPSKIAEMYLLLEKEIDMLQAIEAHKKQVRDDRKIQKIESFFKTIGNPIEWSSDYKNLPVAMDTLETQKGREYQEIYMAVANKNFDKQEHIQTLLNVKLMLRDHNCEIANELIDLIDRSCLLLTRGFVHLEALQMRIEALLLKHIQMPECSFGVTNRMNRVKEQLMEENLFYCHRCQKFKVHEEFPLHSRTERLKACLACSWDDRVMEPWVDAAPYRFILRWIRREERLKSSPSSIAFILQDKDIEHIVSKIWHSHSAINECNDIYQLRLCRWFKDADWAPWNCILLTNDELGTSLRDCIEAWNIGTNIWLRRVVYERVDKYSTVLTYALSALWHGFYPGYYITFANGALFTFASRTMRRTIRDYFTGNAEMKRIYDVITFITTRFVMAYITYTFVLLEFWAGIRLYLHMYLCLHVLAMVALLIVPRVIPKANPGTTTHLTANGSIANVLRSASRPITNSVSNHHD